MKYLLGTNICVYWLKGNEQIEQKILSVGMDNVALSFVNVSELYYGAYKSQRI
jgi:tRNA(fMet)-specific endonuclease VapC